MEIEVTVQNMRFLECLSSEMRVRMIELLSNSPMNIKELSQALGVSSPLVTRNVRMLEEAGIVRSESIAGVRGIQKVCHLTMNRVVLEFQPKPKTAFDCYTISMPIGQYSSFDVKPTCGLVSQEKIIGMLDDPRYFADPDHVHARHLWFGSGYVEYRIPNFLLRNQTASSLEINLELCSEAPGYNENWPSDIGFSVNGVELGIWTCPGDFGSKRGIYTPDWWNATQHGVLKSLTVNQQGTYIDGIRISDTAIGALEIENHKEITFRIACPESAKNCGGISLFGKGFGNYNQDIEIRSFY